MEQVKIQQFSEIHPGHLTEADIKALQPPNGPPTQIRPAGVNHRAEPARRDAGSLLIHGCVCLTPLSHRRG